MHFTVVLLVFLILTTSFAFSATTTTTTTTTFSRRRPEAVSATAQEEEPASSSSTTTTPSSSSRNTAAFMENWQVLGPFPVGSRELGYDPLAAFYGKNAFKIKSWEVRWGGVAGQISIIPSILHCGSSITALRPLTQKIINKPNNSIGGFENIPYSEKDEYPSEICEGGYVKWSLAKGISSSSSPSNGDDNTNQHVIEVGPINYAPQTTIKWDFNSAPFGWVARHHYTYARSTFETSDPGVYLATFSNVVSFKIDNQSFPGNIYNYQHASKSAVWLEPGMHDIYVCIIWDIRVNGG